MATGLREREKQRTREAIHPADRDRALGGTTALQPRLIRASPSVAAATAALATSPDGGHQPMEEDAEAAAAIVADPTRLLEHFLEGGLAALRA